MFVLALRCDVRFPHAQSLKEKRRLMRPLLDGARARFDVSVAETAYQDKWQRCEIGFALVSGEPATVEALADKIEQMVWETSGLEVISITRTWLEE